jgi:general secretion pathway protein N
MTFHRPMSLAALLVMMTAPVMAADASQQPSASPPPLAAEGREGSAALPTPLAAQPLDRLSATRERPLFSPTRRPQPPSPVVAAAPAAPPPPAPPPNVALFGIVMDGEEARAVVRAGPAEKIMRVGIGDDIGGWKVAQIEGRRLVLSLNGRIATFMMFAGNSANGAPRTGADAPSADGQSQAQTQPQNQGEQSPSAPYDPQSPGTRRRRTPR